MDRNIGWDFQKQKSSIPRMKKDKLHKLYNSCVKHNCLGDVSIIDTNSIPDHDLFTYSFPCQDISVAGNQKGLEKGSGTRSGLLWECEKIIAAKKPKYLLMENVKNLVGKKFKADFDKWCEWLETQGYKSFYKVLNAKDYGVPQNRERVFMVSILDENATYEFPEKMPLELRLKDILESVVDDRYYIDNEASNKLLKALEEKGFDKQNDLQKIGNIYPSNGENGNIYMTSGVSPTIKSGQGVVGNGIGSNNAPKIVETKRITDKIINIGNINPSGNGMNGNIIDSEGIAGTVTTNKGEGQKIVVGKNASNLSEIELEKIIIDDTQGFEDEIRTYNEYSSTIRSQRSGLKTVECAAIRGGYEEDGNITQKLGLSGEDGTNTITTVQKDNMIAEKTDELLLYDNLSGGKWDKIHESSRRVYDEKGIAPTIPTCQGRNIEPKVATLESNYRIRKLTPKECWRLMGMKDEHFEKCVDAGLSNSALYKQAGNSIVVDVLEYIFKELFKENIA